MKISILFLMLAATLCAANYTAQRTTIEGVPVISLADAAQGVEVTVLPSIGNRVSEMKVHGKNILFFQSGNLAELQKKPDLSGIPFLAPWANRLDEESFWANGKNYPFNMTLGNVRGPIPVHGLLMNSDLWEVMEVAADRKSARVTSRLAFWKHPELMAQWPFAHEYEMTYRLADGMLETQLTVTNLSADPMPIVLGFHPFYRIPDVPRDQWQANIPARKIVVADSRLVATGEFTPFDLPTPLPLKGHPLDTGFTDLVRDSEGRAHFSIEAAGKKVETLFGPKYPASVIFSPPPAEGQNREFICIEPMAGITDAVNLNHAGKYPNLQTVAPGAKWTESFWVRVSGM
ncbi:MAG: aldose 1-epimerase [Bryobacteraceae bacterium]|jgi:aldose 1-epimerase